MYAAFLLMGNSLCVLFPAMIDCVIDPMYTLEPIGSCQNRNVRSLLS